MFNAMRRQEKQLTLDETRAVLDEAEYGILATMGTHDYPYGVPINYVYHHGSIYFHCATVGNKSDNIEKNSKVCFCVTIDVKLMPADFNTKFKSVIVFGKAKEVFGEEKREGLVALLRKLSSEYIEAGEKQIEKSGEHTKVYKIEIEHITGKGKQ